jgi:hypothetical protein
MTCVNFNQTRIQRPTFGVPLSYGIRGIDQLLQVDRK